MVAYKKDESSAPRAVGVELIQDISSVSPALDGFLHRHRHRIKTLLADGTRTDTFVVDFIDREIHRRNAVAVIVYARAQDPYATKLLLRRQPRYAGYLVTGLPLWTEVFAGLLEQDETPNACAGRELWEEAGLEVPQEVIRTLGPAFFPIPGTLTEQLLPFAAEIPLAQLENAPRNHFPGDGSPFEEGAELIVISYREAFAYLREGRVTDPQHPSLCDAKTEILLWRLWAELTGMP